MRRRQLVGITCARTRRRGNPPAGTRRVVQGAAHTITAAHTCHKTSFMPYTMHEKSRSRLLKRKDFISKSRFALRPCITDARIDPCMRCWTHRPRRRRSLPCAPACPLRSVALRLQDERMWSTVPAVLGPRPGRRGAESACWVRRNGHACWQCRRG